MTMNTNKIIIWLNECEAQSPALVGTKAANLAKLYEAGFPVPQGFCITTDALQDVSDYCDRNVSKIDLERSKNEAQERISRILSHPALQEEIRRSYKILQDSAPHHNVAVRSSAPHEDLSAASFAGQYVSILNVKNEEELFEAIKKCWESAYSVQVQMYRENSGVQEGSPSMAVLVQNMIPAEIAGVLFTVDPLQSNSERIVIEATLGLGDVIAAGSISGFRMSANRNTFELAHFTDSANDWTNLYSKYAWKRLLQSGLQIENILGEPQDIEWAFEKGDFWILQSRPITGIGKKQSREIWSRANAGEIMPNVVTPLTWSIFKPVLQMAGLYRSKSPLTIHWRWAHPSGKWPDSPRLFCGRAYMELGIVYMAFGCMPGVTPDILRRMLGFEYHLFTKDEIPVKRPRWHIMDVYRGVRYWGEMLGFTKSMSKQAGDWTLNNKYLDCHVSLSQMKDPAEIKKTIDNVLQETAKILGLHIQCTSMSFSAVGLLDGLLKHYFEADTIQGFESGLIADSQVMGTVQQNMAIWELAQTARKVPIVCDAIMKSESAEKIIADCESSQEAMQFKTLWALFILRFGNRGTEEFELATPHWDEDPSFVFDRIREVVKHQIPSPQENLDSRNRKWCAECVEIKEYLLMKGGRKEAWLFQRLIDAYREYVPLRENLKYLVVSRFNLLRKIFISLGKYLKDEGFLSCDKDIFFLQYEEICVLLSNDQCSNIDIQHIIRQRKELYNDNVKSTVPDLWLSICGQEKYYAVSLKAGMGVLHGIGCSPGILSGPACVLNYKEKENVIDSGCILVAPSIDPGLTPLFIGAAGLVTEIGGVLSHGATVAREYGLPAVVGVPRATEIIKNGQQITIDGSAGTVYLGNE